MQRLCEPGPITWTTGKPFTHIVPASVSGCVAGRWYEWLTVITTRLSDFPLSLVLHAFNWLDAIREKGNWAFRSHDLWMRSTDSLLARSERGKVRRIYMIRPSEHCLKSRSLVHRLFLHLIPRDTHVIKGLRKEEFWQAPQVSGDHLSSLNMSRCISSVADGPSSLVAIADSWAL